MQNTILLTVFTIILSNLMPTLASNDFDYPVIKINHDNMVVLRGVINGQTSAKVIDKLVSLRSKEIYLFIDSPGGSVDDGLQIVQAIESLQQSGTTIYTIANNAASMAFIIHQCGTERYVRPWSILMQHQISYGSDGQYYNVKAYEHLIDRTHQKLLEKQARRANITVAEFNDLTRHDMWLVGDDAIEKGFADKTVSVMCDFKPELYEEVFYIWMFEIKVTFSTCPLVSKPLRIDFNGNYSQENYNAANEMFDIRSMMIHYK